MPLKCANFPKADPRGIKGAETKNYTAKLFEMISEEITKQISKATGKLTIRSKQIMGQINKMISEHTEDTNKQS